MSHQDEHLATSVKNFQVAGGDLTSVSKEVITGTVRCKDFDFKTSVLVSLVGLYLHHKSSERVETTLIYSNKMGLSKLTMTIEVKQTFSQSQGPTKGIKNLLIGYAVP